MIHNPTPFKGVYAAYCRYDNLIETVSAVLEATCVSCKICDTCDMDRVVGAAETVELLETHFFVCFEFIMIPIMAYCSHGLTNVI